ncbi:hypothetical protein RHMOL_Rhmol05G0252700 [Rhododendron molle]|uniref:Uncharacterized protein n=1 Tax=Rhododendron molle TaxID=49168 RepID=A0ACC0NU83_RHOML|nr:hypothetical protein RHMOL_Rhmol05G0252700 [Rhododendron molle]
MMGQFDLLDYWFNKPHQRVVRRKLWSLLGIKTWVEEYYRNDMLKKYVHKTAVIDPSLLFDPILHFCQCLTRPHLHHRRAVEEVDPFWKDFFDRSLEKQITFLYITTEICCNLEMEGDTTHDAAADQNNRDSIVSQQHTMPGPSDSSLSWEENRKLCRTLSRYMTYPLVMRSSLLPIAASDNYVSGFISGTVSNMGGMVPNFEGVRDVRGACLDIKRLEVRLGDLDKYKIPEQCRLPITEQDIKTGKDLLEEDFVKKNPGWLEELTLMVKTKQKAEIQALSSFGFQYLSELLKLQQKDWL